MEKMLSGLTIHLSIRIPNTMTKNNKKEIVKTNGLRNHLQIKIRKAINKSKKASILEFLIIEIHDLSNVGVLGFWGDRKSVV
jgi:hypothetical protein